MKIAACQWDLAWEDREANYRRARELLAGAGEVDLAVLPEMFATGFSMDVETVAEPDPSPGLAFLREVAGAHDCAALGGLVSRDDDGRSGNELRALAPDGSELVRYRKNRTFRFTGESDHYRRGTELALFEWRGVKIAPLICYDLRFPELFRRLAARGAELFVVIASWPTVRAEHWTTLLRARAIENLAAVVGVNRCGADPANDYPGRSLVIDPLGEIIADGGGEPGRIEAEIDLAALRQWRDTFPALLDLET